MAQVAERARRDCTLNSIRSDTQGTVRLPAWQMRLTIYLIIVLVSSPSGSFTSPPTAVLGSTFVGALSKAGVRRPMARADVDRWTWPRVLSLRASSKANPAPSATRLSFARA
jgi:hypothetical protein